MLSSLVIHPARRSDLLAMEWEGEYLHFRRLYADTYKMMENGYGKIWVAEWGEDGAPHRVEKYDQSRLLGQLFVSYKGARSELADGSVRAYVYGFRIRPTYRNQGLGTQMMLVAENDLLERSFRIVTLNVARSNQAALRFYERLGYYVVAEDPGRWSYIDHTGSRREVHEPAWRMEKMLQRSVV
ncbi:MAG: GNAT family N-acetyltransferase [Anaerolineales bacterium]|nr:GNAT family N-acetyltransferase [Anaerolineales bacterium]